MRQLHYALLAVTVAATSAGAQTTAPAPAGDAAGGGASWFWIILVLLVVGAAIWYFAYARRRSTASGSMGVDRDRIGGSAQQAKGSATEGAGSALGDTKLQAEGRADKVEGKVQNTVDSIKDHLRDK